MAFNVLIENRHFLHCINYLFFKIESNNLYVIKINIFSSLQILPWLFFTLGSCHTVDNIVYTVLLLIFLMACKIVFGYKVD